jgi:hypothetical protein
MARSTKKPATGNPIALLIKSTNPDSFGTHWIDMHACERARDEDNGTEYPRTPEMTAGLMRGVEWHVFRHNRSDAYDRERGPRPLSLEYVKPAFYGVHGVNADDLAPMARTLATLSKRLKSQRETYGYTQDFAENALRIAAAIWAEFLVLPKELYFELVPPSSFARERYAADRWIWIPIRDARPVLDALRDIDLPKPAPNAEKAAS